MIRTGAGTRSGRISGNEKEKVNIYVDKMYTAVYIYVDRIERKSEMVDEELRMLARNIDESFAKIMPMLERLGSGFVEKAKQEKGVELTYAIGWEESGINTICLRRGRKNFSNQIEAYEWQRCFVDPIFKGLRYLDFDAPFGLCD